MGERIADARKRAKLTQAELSGKVDLARTTLVAVEKGERRPSNEELLRIAAALDVPLHELLREGVSTGHISPRFRTSRSGATVAAQEAAVTELERLGRRYVDLERLNGLSRVPAPLESLQSYRARAGERGDLRGLGADAARAVRSALGLGDAPAANLQERLEMEAGLRIFHLDLPASVGALFAWSDELGALVGLNRKQPHERRRLSLAHEVGHFLRDRESGDVLVLDGQPARADPSETFADAFALEFLLPGGGISRAFNDRLRANGTGFYIADLIALADLYQVSFEALTLRLEDLRLIPSGTFERLKRRKVKPEDARRELGLVREAAKLPSRFPTRYISLAVQAFDADELSDGDLAEYLDTDRVTARGIYLDGKRPKLTDSEWFEADLGANVLVPEA
jgi:Zn-dependent peptidase ImmA (M78 family)/transcriptional regulator with XRE-family HTH domain